MADLRLSAEAFEPFVPAGLLRIDLHLVEPVDVVEVHCVGAVCGVRSPPAPLEGRGSVAGRDVRCDSLRWRQDREPRDVDHHDVTRICELVGLPVPCGDELGD